MGDALQDVGEGAVFPVSDAELRAALSEPQDLGPLADPQRRGSCLTGLGYSPTLQVLGGRPLDVPGWRGVLLLVPGGNAEQINAVLVEPTCSAAHRATGPIEQCGEILKSCAAQNAAIFLPINRPPQ